MTKAEELIIQAPRRRRKENRYTEAELGAFADAWHLPILAQSPNAAIKVGEAPDENSARTIARDAQRELLALHGVDARTSVFKDPTTGVFQAALRRKSGQGGGPGVAAGNAAPTAADPAPAAGPNAETAWNPAMVGSAGVKA